MRQRAFLLCVGIFCFISIAFTSDQKVLLNLPVRILDLKPETRELKKMDFNVLINGEKREINTLLKRERSIRNKPDLKRSFILSFRILEYGKHISGGISHFVYEFINPGDLPVLITPVKLYKFNVSNNKVLLLSESFPIRELSDLTLGQNITYNVIFFNSFLSSSKKSALDAAPDLGGILKKISKKSGGKSITTDNIDQAMAGLKNHRDFYYELLVDLDEKTEKKR